MRLTVLFAALGLIAFTIAGFTLASGTAEAKTVDIVTGNFFFCDSSHTGNSCETQVNAGDTVTWTIGNGFHRVVQCTDNTFSNCTGGFDLGDFSTGQSVSRTFDTAGDFYYHCEIHPDQMKGEIAVAAAVTATPTPTTAASQTAAASATATPKAVPQTGGSPDGGTSPWTLALLAIGGVMVTGSVATLARARRRRD